jgi:hypothetical protein
MTDRRRIEDVPVIADLEWRLFVLRLALVRLVLVNPTKEGRTP